MTKNFLFSKNLFNNHHRNKPPKKFRLRREIPSHREKKDFELHRDFREIEIGVILSLPKNYSDQRKSKKIVSDIFAPLLHNPHFRVIYFCESKKELICGRSKNQAARFFWVVAATRWGESRRRCRRSRSRQSGSRRSATRIERSAKK